MNKYLYNNIILFDIQCLLTEFGSNITRVALFIMYCIMLVFLLLPQGSNGTNQEICGSPLATVENSETTALVVGLAIMFILVIYSRLVMLITS